MIFPKKTVFVVGAGASVPYGFPTGAELLQDAIALWKPETVAEAALRFLTFEMKQDGVGLQETVRLALECRVSSLDELVRDHPDRADAARLMIAHRLLLAEHNAHRKAQDTGHHDWIEHLVREALRHGPDQLRSLGFITFNFDRLIGWSITKIAEGRFGRDRGIDLGTNIQVVHLSGQLGTPEWKIDPDDGQGTVLFGSKVTADTIVRAAKRIQFVSEARADDAKAMASGLIKDAELVCFLGFAFHPDNVHALGLVTGGTGGPNMIASGVGLTRVEAREIESRVHPNLRIYEDVDCLTLLRSAPHLYGRNELLAQRPWFD